jgi:hypothetical protein
MEIQSVQIIPTTDRGMRDGKRILKGLCKPDIRNDPYLNSMHLQ